MLDHLVEVVRADLPILRDYYKTDWPKHNIGYGILDNYIRWLEHNPNLPDLHICSLNGDWSDGTFIVLDSDLLFFNTLSKNFTRLEIALNLVDYSKQPVISSMESKLLDMVLKVIKDKGLDYSLIETKWHWMSNEKAAKLTVKLPDGLTIKSLSEKDLHTINEIWPFKHPGSVNFLRRLANNNINYGAFTDDGELVAWCLRHQAGGLGTLQVADSHKRKGLGTLMVKVMAKTISETGSDIFAQIVPANQPSLDMFSKLGFTVIDRMYKVSPKAYFDSKYECNMQLK